MKNCGIKLLPEEQKDIAEMLEYIAVTLCAPTAALKLYNVLNRFTLNVKYLFFFIAMFFKHNC